MKKYSDEVNNFLLNYVLPKMNLKDYSENNIGDIVQYMFSNIEGPLCDKEEDGKTLTLEESKLLKVVTEAINEITTRDDWDK